ncbi:MAG: hypothetical protein K2F87_06730 [Muribaculaceae bacterium]|nr:hypothetical protein [Muribaculaceae bacterium]
MGGRKAAIRKDSTFDIISENRDFTGADAFSLDISFPLRGCDDNLAIFGHVNNLQVARSESVFDCEIYAGSRIMTGALVVTEISPAEVKGQFLQGRSARNFRTTLEDVYINELDLGECAMDPELYTPQQLWQITTSFTGVLPMAVPLPWVSADSGNMQNEVQRVAGQWRWKTKELSAQPYLYNIVKAICQAVGYSCDLDEWWADPSLRYLLVCNTLPAAWDTPQYARALPHWSVIEFFEKLELFLECEFEVDHRDKSVRFRKRKSVLENLETVTIDRPVDEFSVSVDYDNKDTRMAQMRRRKYKEAGHEMQKFYACEWFVRMMRNYGHVTEYETLQALVDANRSYMSANPDWGHRGSPRMGILYAKDCDTYYMLVPVWREWQEVYSPDTAHHGRWVYTSVLKPVNMFGDPEWKENDDDAQVDELDFVPAWLDDTDADKGTCLFLDCGSWAEGSSEDSSAGESDDPEAIPFFKPNAMVWLEKGDDSKKQEYYDKIYIGYWDGTAIDNSRLPYPSVYDVEVSDDGSITRYRNFSLRLRKDDPDQARNIDVTTKMKFSFLADDIPDPRAPFVIRGRRYVCEKITTTFSDNGMSRLMSGEFWPVLD